MTTDGPCEVQCDRQRVEDKLEEQNVVGEMTL